MVFHLFLGININSKEKKSFIQVITNNTSYFINYDINAFKYNFKPFYIKIGENYFCKNGIHIDIKDETQNLNIYGDIKYLNSQNIKTSTLSPNIMGPFSYIPFMECNHAILSMKNKIYGYIKINDNKINFNNNIGYIEKDWGCSFPKSYIWCQGNNFINSNASFMLSIADIPFKLFNFRGVICVLMIDNKEYKFTTYNNAKLVKYDVADNFINIILTKGSYTLTVNSNLNNAGYKLFAPIKGRMEKDILESINAEITVTLKEKNNIIFSDTSKNCGLEIVNE